MTARRLLCLIALGVFSLAAFAPAAPAAEQGHAAGGLVKEGTTGQFDSINPFVAFNAWPYIVFTNTYPTLVQYNTNFKFEGDWAKSWTTSKDGLTWTFKLKPGKWSDGKPLTADDGAWTGNLILKYQKTVASSLAPFLSHATKLTAPNPSTLVIHYNKAVANVLPQLQQFFILPRHIWEPQVGVKGRGLKNYDPGRAPADRRGRLLLRHEVRQEGHDDPAAQPRLLRAEAEPRRGRHHVVRERRRDARGAQER